MRVSPRNASDARALSAGRPYQHAPAAAHVREHDQENKPDVEEPRDTDFMGFPRRHHPRYPRWRRFMIYGATRESIDRSPVHRLTPFIKGRTIAPWCGTAIAREAPQRTIA
jgi:hypothetical protein